jgi:hypothetical protein
MKGCLGAHVRNGMKEGGSGEEAALRKGFPPTGTQGTRHSWQGCAKGSPVHAALESAENKSWPWQVVSLSGPASGSARSPGWQSGSGTEHGLHAIGPDNKGTQKKNSNKTASTQHPGFSASEARLVWSVSMCPRGVCLCGLCLLVCWSAGLPSVACGGRAERGCWS